MNLLHISFCTKFHIVCYNGPNCKDFYFKRFLYLLANVMCSIYINSIHRFFNVLSKIWNSIHQKYSFS